MKKLLSMTLIVLLLSVSVALAETPPPAASTETKKFSVVVTAPTSPAPPTTEGATTTTPTAATPKPPSDSVRLYEYQGPGGSVALDERPPSEFKDSLPKEWGETKPVYKGYIDVSKKALPQIEQQMKFFGTLPAGVYEGKVVFRSTTGKFAVIKGTTTYGYDKDSVTVTEYTTIATVPTALTRTYSVADGRYYYDLDKTIDGMRVVYDTQAKEYRYVKADGTLATADESAIYTSSFYTELEGVSVPNDAALNDINAEIKETQAIVAREQQLAKWGAVWSELGSYVWYAQQYGGMAGWSSLFFSKEQLEKWSSTVNDFFCKTVILGGTDCWVSKICGRYSDVAAPRGGVLFTSPVGGAPQAVAHIEGTRSLPIPHGTETLHVYTVTFGITNTLDKSMTYNVRFNGPVRTAHWWSTPQPLSKGGTASALGGGALIKASAREYTTICLEFDPSMQSFDGKKISELCNSFAEYGGSATAPYGPEPNATVAQQTIGPAATPATPGANV